MPLSSGYYKVLRCCSSPELSEQYVVYFPSYVPDATNPGSGTPAPYNVGGTYGIQSALYPSGDCVQINFYLGASPPPSSIITTFTGFVGVGGYANCSACKVAVLLQQN
jgi:hypothetical protein